MKDKFIQTIELLNYPKPKSSLTIGHEMITKIYVDTKFNKFQKFMWKFLLNIKIEDVED